jgi:hypothetical protein
MSHKEMAKSANTLAQTEQYKRIVGQLTGFLGIEASGTFHIALRTSFLMCMRRFDESLGIALLQTKHDDF